MMTVYKYCSIFFSCSFNSFNGTAYVGIIRLLIIITYNCHQRLIYLWIGLEITPLYILYTHSYRVPVHDPELWNCRRRQRARWFITTCAVESGENILQYYNIYRMTPQKKKLKNAKFLKATRRLWQTYRSLLHGPVKQRVTRFRRQSVLRKFQTRCRSEDERGEFERKIGEKNENFAGYFLNGGLL